VRPRAGFQLTEVLVAVAIAAGPMLVAIHLVQKNAAGARFNHDRASARLVLLDVTEIMMGEPLDRLKAIAAQPGELARTFELRVANLPATVRDRFRNEVRPYLGQIKMTIDENLSPETPDLTRLTVVLPLGDRAEGKVEIRRFFRPLAARRPRGIPEKSRPR
jgi:hypothetical protein